jgi:isopenicillin N synthase-like dioxygenase
MGVDAVVTETGVPLPVVDMTALRTDPEGAGVEPVIDALRVACRERGFFSLAGHGISADRSTQVLGMARAFFALPEAEKLEIENINSPQFRGYTRVGQEQTNGRPDQREQLDVGVERVAREPGAGEPAYWRLLGPNQWPASLPELREVLLAYMDEMERVAMLLVRALARSLGQPADRFDATFTPDPSPHLKLIRYPPGVGSDQGVGAHKDYGYLAILLQDENGGLQVGAPGGMVDVPPVEGTFVCNIGEMFEITSRGYYEATTHRVVSPPPGRDRVSVPYFFGPRLDAALEPVDLPDALQAEVDREGGRMPDPHNPIFSEFGRNALRGWLRSHPEVARRHWSDLVGPFSSGRSAG